MARCGAQGVERLGEAEGEGVHGEAPKAAAQGPGHVMGWNGYPVPNELADLTDQREFHGLIYIIYIIYICIYIYYIYMVGTSNLGS